MKRLVLISVGIALLCGLLASSALFADCKACAYNPIYGLYCASAGTGGYEICVVIPCGTWPSGEVYFCCRERRGCISV